MKGRWSEDSMWRGERYMIEVGGKVFRTASYVGRPPVEPALHRAVESYLTGRNSNLQEIDETTWQLPAII
jgi:hypothetical protein